MSERNEAELPEQTQDHRPRCPTCAASPRLALPMTDPRTGRTLRLFQCQSCERIWDDVM
jgi:formate dehydrogenase maturation protein FdhE